MTFAPSSVLRKAIVVRPMTEPTAVSRSCWGQGAGLANLSFSASSYGLQRRGPSSLGHARLSVESWTGCRQGVNPLAFPIPRVYCSEVYLMAGTSQMSFFHKRLTIRSEDVRASV